MTKGEKDQGEVLVTQFIQIDFHPPDQVLGKITPKRSGSDCYSQTLVQQVPKKIKQQKKSSKFQKCPKSSKNAKQMFQKTSKKKRNE